MWDKLLVEFQVAGPASEQDVEAAEMRLGRPFPPDFRDFLLTHGGGEGFIGHHYLVIWKASELAKFNDAYEVAKYAPGFVVFGSDGGAEGFAFDARGGKFNVVEVPFIGMSLEDGLHVADSFTELLGRMHSVDGSLF